MDKTITTALLIVIGMVMAVTLFNVAFPAVQSSSDAMANMASRADDRLRTQAVIIQASGELDSDGWWQDSNNNGYFDVFVWVKNVGSVTIDPLSSVDVFFGPEGDFVRIPSDAIAKGSFPNWSSDFENATQWTPSATLLITIHYESPLSSGRYYVKVSLPDGDSVDYFMGL